MRIPSILFIAASFCCLSSCGEGEESNESPKKDPPSPPTSPAWPATKTTDQGSFEVTIQPGGGEIVRNKHFVLRVSLAAKKGEAKDISVAVDADMPEHQHGMNTKPKITAEGPTLYKVEGMLFHMAGNWVITVEVNREGKMEVARFPVSIE